MTIHVIGYPGSARASTLQFEGPPPGALKVEVAWGYGIYDTSPTWVDIATDLRKFKCKRGRKHELDRIEAGTAEIELDNASGNYWRNNTNGAYTPNVKPLTPIRINRSHAGTDYPIWQGMIESLKPDWTSDRGGYGPIMRLQCVDLFKLLSLGSIARLTGATGLGTNCAALTADAASGQKIVYVDLNEIGNIHVGQALTIGKDGPVTEVGVVQAKLNSNGKITLQSNLANAYATADHAYVKKFPMSPTGQRVADVLCELGVPSALQALDTGVRTVAEFVPAEDGSNAMEHLFNVARDEEGRLFMSADGVVTFLDNVARQSAPYKTSQATFRDDGTANDYVMADLVDDDEFIYNEAMVAGDAFPTQAVVDATAQAAQGRRVLERTGSLLSSASQAFVQAYEIVNRWADSKFRLNGLLLLPDVDPDVQYPIVLALDILHRITYELTQAPNPAMLTEEYEIEGIEHEWDAATDVWQAVWQLWDINTYQDYASSASDAVDSDALEAEYLTAHDKAVGSTGPLSLYVGQQLVGGANYGIWRAIVEFDTSALDPLLTVNGASVIVQLSGLNPLTADVTLHLVEAPVGVVEPLVAADFGAIEVSETSFGSVSIATGYPPATVIIALNATGIAAINAGGTTRFCLRTGDDISATAPTTTVEYLRPSAEFSLVLDVA